jgi:hypothetical protein
MTHNNKPLIFLNTVNLIISKIIVLRKKEAIKKSIKTKNEIDTYEFSKIIIKYKFIVQI